MSKPEADYEIGGYWGNNISWWTKDWSKTNDVNFLPKVHGNIQPDEQPIVGNTIVSEFRKSWRVFEVVKITREKSPKDMFWADCKLIEIVKKES